MIETSEKLELAESPLTNGIAERESPKKEVNRFIKKKKSKKKAVIAIVIAGAVIAGSIFVFGKKGVILPVESITLEKRELINTVSLTGTVESAEAIHVYTSLGSTVNSVNVIVGDRVNEGDVLAQLDTADLLLTIAQQQASINQSAKSSELGISISEKEYANASSDLDNDMNSSLVNAEQSLKRAQQSLNDARLDLNEHKEDLDHADEVMNALEKKLGRARDAFQSADKAYTEAERNLKAHGTPIPQDIIDTFNQTEKEYNDILKEWNTSNTEYGGELSVYSKTYRQARLDYESALANKNIAEKEAQRRLDSLNDSIKQNEVASNQSASQIGLQKLQKQLSDSTLTAPISGTVTAVYAKVGAPGSGLMFVIENTDDLLIKTKIKEYDITDVKEGMAATVKSDATGDTEFDGEIKRIYPAAIKSIDGSTQTGGNVEFESEVALITKDSGLRVGMNVRMNVITAQKESVYAVQYEAVITDEQGQHVIYIAKANAENKMITQAIPVTTDMETDFYIEISSASIADGDIVLANPTGIVAGSEVTLMPNGTAANSAEGAAPMGPPPTRG